MSIPPIVFLGLCERAVHVRDRNTNLYKWNILGLKTIVLSGIYPLSIESLQVGFAIHPEALKEGFRIRILNERDEQAGFMDLSTVPLDAPDAPPLKGPDAFQILASTTSPTVFFFPLRGMNWVVPAPGTYRFFMELGEELRLLGDIRFELIEFGELSETKIAAIRSDAQSSKVVRMNLGCRHCDTQFRTYTALDRDRDMEGEGWLWYREIPDSFECRCGRTKLDLTITRRNLHGFLGGRHIKDSTVDFFPLYERNSISSLCTEFLELIRSDPPEETLQQFIWKNPLLLNQFSADRIIPKAPILTYHVTDFAILTSNKQLLLVELEKTNTRLLNKNGDTAAPLTHALNQVQQWLHAFDDHRLAILDTLGISRDDVNSIKGIVVAGRDSNYQSNDLRRLKAAHTDPIRFLTYDDLLNCLKNLSQELDRL